jgi:hypothetical protein
MSSPAAPDSSLDTLIDSFTSPTTSDAVPGPSRGAKKEITMAEFQKVLDSTPLFMRETPDGTEENPIFDALKSLMFEGEGDGESPQVTTRSRGHADFPQKSL